MLKASFTLCVSVFVVRIFAITSQAYALDSAAYEVYWRDQKVGESFVSVDRGVESTVVSVRTRAKIGFWGISFRNEDTQQVAAFDHDGRLLWARARGDVNGRLCSVDLASSPSGLEINQNGVHKHIDYTQVSGTSLDAFYRQPQTGVYFDLLTASLKLRSVRAEADVSEIQFARTGTRFVKDSNKVVQIDEVGDRFSFTYARAVSGPDAARQVVLPNLIEDQKILDYRLALSDVTLVQ